MLLLQICFKWLKDCCCRASLSESESFLWNFVRSNLGIRFVQQCSDSIRCSSLCFVHPVLDQDAIKQK